jgi:hypothetical protein
VTNGSVFAIRDEFLTTPGPPLVTGLHALAHVLRPTSFPAPPRFANKPVVRRMGSPVIK